MEHLFIGKALAAKETLTLREGRMRRRDNGCILSAFAFVMVRVPIRMGGVLLLCGILGISSSVAQSSNQDIAVAAVVRVAPGAETPMRIGLDNEREIPRRAMLVFRGLPPGVRFNEGRQFGPGVWVAPAVNASNLSVFIPVDAPGSIMLKVELTTLEGETLTSTQVKLSTASATANFTTTPTVASIASGTSAVGAPELPPVLSPEDRATALKLMKKAEEYMDNGSVIVARRLFQGAADRGLGDAAYALAQTYDGQQLAKIKNLVGVMPDPGLANKWYAKARELGYSGGAGR